MKPTPQPQGRSSSRKVRVTSEPTYQVSEARGRLRTKGTQQTLKHAPRRLSPGQGSQDRQMSLPCTSTHSTWLKALYLLMAFTRVWALTQYVTPGCMVSRSTGEPPLLTSLMCSLGRAETRLLPEDGRTGKGEESQGGGHDR
jgi:hypothetical protein